MFRDLLVWMWILHPKQDTIKISEILEIEHKENMKEQEAIRNRDRMKHIEEFYWLLKERRLENISRRSYREWHLKWNTSFIVSQKPNAKTKKTS